MNQRGTRSLGVVKLVQIQPDGLIRDIPGSSQERSWYDASRLVEVDRLEITTRGIHANESTGKRVLDIHHLDHPDKAYDDDDLVSIGFTAHYDAMRHQFGVHMADGIAGENIIIDHPDEIWPDRLSNGLRIENQETGELADLGLVSFAAPCVEFSRFCLENRQGHVSAPVLGETLRFLGNGRRGFLLVLNDVLGTVTVRTGDRVFSLG